MVQGKTDEESKQLIEFLRFQVKELDSQLKKAKATIARYEKVANITNNTIQNESIEEKNQLRTPARMIKHLSWLGKVIFVLQAAGRPMSSSELFDEVDDLDGELSFRNNPKVLLSVVLHKAVKEQRLTLHQVVGKRGGYYALKEWTDEKRNLKSNFRSQLF